MLKADFIPITGVGVDIKNNRLIVRIKDYNSKNKVYSENIYEYVSYDFKNVIYEEGDYYQDQVTYNPGEEIFSSAGSATMGYRSRIEHPISGDLVRGFWTAGHVVDSTDSAVWLENYVALGSCLVRQNADKVDAAFIELEDQSYTIISQDLKYGGKTLESTFLLTFAADTTVYICGAVCGEQEGIITDPNCSYTQESTGQYFYDMMEANYSSYAGDSGAVVYTLVNDEYTRCGIHKGVRPSTAYRITTKSSNMTKIWNHYTWN